jgi:hypothetical protein
MTDNDQIERRLIVRRHINSPLPALQELIDPLTIRSNAVRRYAGTIETDPDPVAADTSNVIPWPRQPRPLAGYRRGRAKP